MFLYAGILNPSRQSMKHISPHFSLRLSVILACSQVPTPLPPTIDPSGVKHNAKVVLLTVDSDSAQHLTFQLRFLVCKVEKGLVCPGGAWNTVDGADPYDEDVLRNTAMYAFLALTGYISDFSSVAKDFRDSENFFPNN